MKVRFPFILLLLASATLKLAAQGTAFNYQGHLNDTGAAANAAYDFRFTVYNALTSGSAVSRPATNPAVAVSNGLFSVTLDFGPGIFTGNNAWLELAVRAAGATNFIPLSPRQPVLPVPYALFAAGASNLLGPLAASQLAGPLPATLLSGTYPGPVNFTGSGNTFSGAFTGNGGGLTNLNLEGSGGVTNGQSGITFLPNLVTYSNVFMVGGPTNAGSGSANGSYLAISSNTFAQFANPWAGTFNSGSLSPYVTNNGARWLLYGLTDPASTFLTPLYRGGAGVSYTNGLPSVTNGNWTASGGLSPVPTLQFYPVYTFTNYNSGLSGNGGTLTNISAGAFNNQTGNAAGLTNPANVFAGSFSGNGSSLTNLPGPTWQYLFTANFQNSILIKTGIGYTYSNNINQAAVNIFGDSFSVGYLASTNWVSIFENYCNAICPATTISTNGANPVAFLNYSISSTPTYSWYQNAAGGNYNIGNIVIIETGVVDLLDGLTNYNSNPALSLEITTSNFVNYCTSLCGTKLVILWELPTWVSPSLFPTSSNVVYSAFCQQVQQYNNWLWTLKTNGGPNGVSIVIFDQNQTIAPFNTADGLHPDTLAQIDLGNEFINMLASGDSSRTIPINWAIVSQQLGNNTATITATGWTNNLGVNAVCYLTAATNLALYDGPGTNQFTGQNISAFTPIIVQPNGYFTGTGIIAKGKAHGF